tara:strand:- start:4148 stop:4345 length:198 start_codon:yes stop_codon:yes gene_type:complete
MSERKISYIIIKNYINSRGVTIPTILIDNIGEIMEFEEIEEATKLAMLFETNSDSGWKYTIRKIG